MKGVKVIFCAAVCLLITSSIHPARAKEIWRIGETNNKCEFSQPESTAFSTSLCCFAYQDKNIWQEVDFFFVDGNTIALNVKDGGNGDCDEGEVWAIDAILALSYKQQLDVSVDKGGCFLRSLAWRK